LVGDFKIGNLRNKLLVGVDYLSKKITDNSSNWGYLHTVTLQGDLPYGEPVVNATNLNTALSGSGNINSDIHQNILGAYVSDVINILPELSFMASVRYDRFQYDGDQNTDSDNETEYTKSTLSPKFGIVYQPILNEVSVFANYQNGFSYVNPQYITDYETGVAITTLQSYDVEEANQLEIGVKTSMFNNKLETTLSYYNITVQNKYLFYTKTQDNKINSQGIEFDVNANPINGLNIHTGFSYNDSKVKDAPNATYLEGLRYQESGPEISYNFWADYQFKEGFAKNFGLGAGFNGTSNYDTMVGYKYVTGSFNLPAYTIFNASAYYETDTFRIGVKANNLTDKTYYSGWSTITPEQPRSFIATLAYKF
jgi:iron complex outermembrane receptor protein